MAAAASGRSFTYVHVPLDEGAPLAELRASVPPELEGQDALLQLLRPHFQGGRIVDVSHLRSEFGAAQVEQRMGQLQAMCAVGTVEVFALTRSSKSTLPGPHQSTFLYLDEMGALKGLGVNTRAAAIAAQCGLDVESPFLGDCFIGRVRILPAPTAMVDFALAELSAGSPWLSCAPSENHMYNLAAQKHGVASIAARKHPEAGARAAAATADEQRAAAGGHRWEQSDEDVEVTLTLPPALGGAKGIRVSIEPTTVRVVPQADGPALLELALWGRVHPNESTWTVNGGVELQISLEKVEPGAWGALEAAS
jgi:hypothetical protein|eukprot:COSAG01_NODE_752_length_13837_cov_76.381670_11_plen_309_part_00